MVDDAEPDRVEVNLYETRKGARRRPVAERIDVRVGPEQRRNWSPEDKLANVRGTLELGAVANRHGISTGLLFTWCKRMLATARLDFMPVRMVPEAMATPSAPAEPVAAV